MRLLTGVLILLMSMIGHWEWWVIGVNRFYSLRIRATTLRKLRNLHDLAFLGYPPLIMWLAGIGPNGLLTGGTWATLGSGTRMLLLVTMAGMVPWTLGVLRWQWFRRREFRDAVERTVFDVERLAESGAEKAAVQGTRWHPSKVWPWNDLYRIEVNRKQVRLSSDGVASTPTTDASPLRIAHLSDLHFIDCPGVAYYQFVVRQVIDMTPDIIVFTGDLLDRMQLLHLAIETLQPLTRVAPCVFILGNHDWRYDHDELRRQMVASGWINVGGTCQTLTVAGRELLVAGTEMPWLLSPPVVPPPAPGVIRVLLSHAPDQLPFALRNEFDLMLSGHTHGGQVVLPLVGPVYSPSRYGVSYAAGLFRDEFTRLTLHVSRGVGAKDPLRWRCPPEVTLLEVQ